jgi:hypothetical protein
MLGATEPRRRGIDPALEDLAGTRCRPASLGLGLGVHRQVGDGVLGRLITRGMLTGPDRKDQGLVADRLTDGHLEADGLGRHLVHGLQDGDGEPLPLANAFDGQVGDPALRRFCWRHLGGRHGWGHCRRRRFDHGGRGLLLDDCRRSHLAFRSLRKHLSGSGRGVGWGVGWRLGCGRRSLLGRC